MSESRAFKKPSLENSYYAFKNYFHVLINLLFMLHGMTLFVFECNIRVESIARLFVFR